MIQTRLIDSFPGDILLDAHADVYYVISKSDDILLVRYVSDIFHHLAKDEMVCWSTSETVPFFFRPIDDLRISSYLYKIIYREPAL